MPQCRARVDAFVAARQVGPAGRIVGVDMTAEMLAKSRTTAVALGLEHVEVRDGLAEALPGDDGWADVVISNGVISLCVDKRAANARTFEVFGYPFVARRLQASYPVNPPSRSGRRERAGRRLP